MKKSGSLHRLLSLAGVTIATAGMFTFSTQAHAGVRIPIPVSWGAKCFRMGRISLEKIPNQEQEKQGVVIQKCDHHFGLFWASVVNFGCQPKLYKTSVDESSVYCGELEALDKVYGIHPTQAADLEKLEKEHPLSSAERGFWEKQGRWVLLILLIVALVFLGRGKSSEDDEQESQNPA